MKNLSHSASFESLDKNAPPKDGTKHLGANKFSAEPSAAQKCNACPLSATVAYALLWRFDRSGAAFVPRARYVCAAQRHTKISVTTRSSGLAIDVDVFHRAGGTGRNAVAQISPRRERGRRLVFMVSVLEGLFRHHNASGLRTGYGRVVCTGKASTILMLPPQHGHPAGSRAERTVCLMSVR
jgi:hypothetical protein